MSASGEPPPERLDPALIAAAAAAFLAYTHGADREAALIRAAGDREIAAWATGGGDPAHVDGELAADLARVAEIAARVDADASDGRRDK